MSDFYHLEAGQDNTLRPDGLISHVVLSQSPYSASQSVVIRSPLAHGSALTSQSKTRALNRPVDRHREALALARYRVMCPARGLNPEPLDCESDTLPLSQVAKRQAKSASFG